MMSERVIGSGFRAEEGSVIGGVPMVFRDGKLVDVKGGLVIGDNVWVGSCSVIMNGDTRPTWIGPDVIIGPNVTIGHDSRIGKGAQIMVGAHLAGYVEIGEGAVICMGALIRNQIKIGRGAVIGMGAVVVKDIPAHCVAYGNPARVNVKKSIKKHFGDLYRRVLATVKT